MDLGMEERPPLILKGQKQYFSPLIIGKDQFGPIFKYERKSQLKGLNRQFIAKPFSNLKLSQNQRNILDTIKQKRHKNIVLFDQAKGINGKGYFIIEYCQCTLQQLLPEMKNNTLFFIYQLCELLKCIQFIHQNKLFHGDIRPENIFATFSDKKFVQSSRKKQFFITLKFWNFGIGECPAKITYQNNLPINQSDKNAYKAPQQVQSGQSQRVDEAKCDIWSLGVIFLEIASGATLNGQYQQLIKQAKDERSLTKYIRQKLKNQYKTKQNILSRMLNYDAKNRISAKEAKQYLKNQKNWFLSNQPKTGSQVQDMRQQLQQLKKKMKNEQKKIETLTKRNSQLQQQKKEIQNKNTQMKQKLKNAESDNKKLEKKIEQLRNNKQKSNEEKQNRMQELIQLLQKNTKYTQQLQNMLKIQMEKNKQIYKEIQKQMKKNMKQLQEKKQEIQEAKGKIRVIVDEQKFQKFLQNQFLKIYDAFSWIELQDHLNFSHRPFDVYDQLPKKLFTLTSVKKLYLHNAKLVKVPQDFGKLINLEELSLQRNPMLKQLPRFLLSLKKLKVLSMDIQILPSSQLNYQSLTSLKDLTTIVLYYKKNAYNQAFFWSLKNQGAHRNISVNFFKETIDQNTYNFILRNFIFWTFKSNICSFSEFVYLILSFNFAFSFFPLEIVSLIQTFYQTLFSEVHCHHQLLLFYILSIHYQ